MQKYPRYKVAAMHVSPVFLDSEKTIDKACSLIEEAANNGAGLVAFPEAYVPCFPLWSSLRAPALNNEYFRKLAANAIHVPGPEVRRVAEVARRRNVIVSLGINEGSAASVGLLWNASLLIGQDGHLLNHHRKIVPTYYEKLVWANGDGAGLRVVETTLGRIGSLICGENGNALARHTLMSQGEQVHIAHYPTAWLTNSVEAVQIRTASNCTEAKVFTIAVSMYLSEEAKDILADGDRKLRDAIEARPRSESLIMGPTGELKSEVMLDDEGIAYGEIDLQDCVVPKQWHDYAGYYNRFDIFNLTVDRSTNEPVTFSMSRGRRETINMDLTEDLDNLRLRSARAAE